MENVEETPKILSIPSKVFEKHLKKTMFYSNVVGILVACLGALSITYGFYYQTTYTQDKHTEQIEVLQETTSDLTESSSSHNVTDGIAETELVNLKVRMDRMEKSNDRIENKIDQLLLRPSN